MFKCVCPNYELVTKVNFSPIPMKKSTWKEPPVIQEYLYIVGSHSIRRRVSINREPTRGIASG